MEAVISPVRRLIGSERHVPYHAVKETVRILCALKPLYGDMVLLVELPGDPAGNAVDLNAVHLKG